MAVRIRVYDNGRYQDEEAAYDLSEEFNEQDALTRCRAMVDDDLAEVYEQGMSAEALIARYQMDGRDPVIIGASEQPFSAWTYAAARAGEMVAATGAQSVRPMATKPRD